MVTHAAYRQRLTCTDQAETGATVVHYLGVIAPVLLKLAPGEHERRHKVRFGIGAGIEPEPHAAFAVSTRNRVGQVCG
jgi:hypothetical protein